MCLLWLLCVCVSHVHDQSNSDARELCVIVVVCVAPMQIAGWGVTGTANNVSKHDCNNGPEDGKFRAAENVVNAETHTGLHLVVALSPL